MASKELSDWNRLDTAFAAAIELPEAVRRIRLEEMFPDEPEAIEHVIRLLGRETDSRHRFDRLLAQRNQFLANAAAQIELLDDDPRIGARYGSWRILQRIAAGGFSVVYEALRDDGRYEQAVALKIIRGGLSGDAVRHFLRERRILSKLDHPGIVRILDAGETATGAPWLVMELAAGKTIPEYCQYAGLGVNDRLALVADIAEALQSAHARLVIHRDIKPDNIIVSEDGRAKLLDFGVASLVAAQDEGDHVSAMTPEYASPEQLEFGEITTASDIYQLGRVLEELCEPCQPLTLDLRAVLEKATSHSPSARYETASGLADDIRRLMRGDPPIARSGTKLEAVARLIKRNRIASVLSVILFAAFLGWVGTLSIHAHQMEEQRALALAAADRAERGRGVLLELFRRMDPLQIDGAVTISNPINDLIEPTLSDVQERLFDDPQLQIELIGWAALLNERAGDEEKALELADQAIQILEGAGDQSSTAYANAITYRGTLSITNGNRETGEEAVSRALSIAQAAPLDDRNALATMIRAAWARHGHWSEQRELFEAALPRLIAGTANSEIEVRTGLGRALLELGETTEAESQMRLALSRGESAYGPNHVRLALPLSDLAKVLTRRGHAAEAIAAHRRAYDLSLSAFGQDYKSTLSHQNNLALALAGTDEKDEAIHLLESVIAAYHRIDGPASLRAGRTLQNLATLQIRTGQNEAALGSLEQAEAIFSAHLTEGTPMRAFPLLTRSEAFLNLGRFVESEASATAAFEMLKLSLPTDHYAIEIARCRIGMALYGRGLTDAARPYIEHAIEALTRADGVPERHFETCRSAAYSQNIDIPP